MPEGPTIVILSEQVERFAGCRILRAEGNAKIDMTRLTGRRVEACHSWGKRQAREIKATRQRSRAS